MANKKINVVIDDREHTINDYVRQRNVYHIDAALVAQNDTIEMVFGSEPNIDAMNSLDIHSILPTVVDIFTHNGGVTGTVNANWAVNNGQTIEFQANDPNIADQTEIELGKSKDDWYKKFTHTLKNGTNGAFTAAQLKDSLMGDKEFLKWGYAEVGLTANRVSIFPKGLEGKLQVTGGTAQAVILFPTTLMNNKNRIFTYVPVIAADWTITFNGETRTLTTTRINAASATKVLLRVRQF